MLLLHLSLEGVCGKYAERKHFNRLRSRYIGLERKHFNQLRSRYIGLLTWLQCGTNISKIIAAIT